MIRLATAADIPWLVEQMLRVKAETNWRTLEGDYTAETLRPFLTTCLGSAHSVCYLWDDPMDAFCGVTLGAMYLPPHLPYVFEWGWAGPSRHSIECWRACRRWGQRHGAVLAARGLADSRTTQIRETITWERL